MNKSLFTIINVFIFVIITTLFIAGCSGDNAQDNILLEEDVALDSSDILPDGPDTNTSVADDDYVAQTEPAVDEPTDTEDCVESTFYLDEDGDSFGNDFYPLAACEKPDGYVSDNTDCDDANFYVNPGRTDDPETLTTSSVDPALYEEIDNDCDGDIDEDVAEDSSGSEGSGTGPGNFSGGRFGSGSSSSGSDSSDSGTGSKIGSLSGKLNIGSDSDNDSGSSTQKMGTIQVTEKIAAAIWRGFKIYNASGGNYEKIQGLGFKVDGNIDPSPGLLEQSVTGLTISTENSSSNSSLDYFTSVRANSSIMRIGDITVPIEGNGKKTTTKVCRSQYGLENFEYMAVILRGFILNLDEEEKFSDLSVTTYWPDAKECYTNIRENDDTECIDLVVEASLNKGSELDYNSDAYVYVSVIGFNSSDVAYGASTNYYVNYDFDRYPDSYYYDDDTYHMYGFEDLPENPELFAGLKNFSISCETSSGNSCSEKIEYLAMNIDDVSLDGGNATVTVRAKERMSSSDNIRVKAQTLTLGVKDSDAVDIYDSGYYQTRNQRCAFNDSNIWVCTAL